ncbi:MAG: TIM barrel protein [Chloroflexi bacterium]|nr:TIM barrel protein [Chloroflexota bacterium]
MEKLLFGTGGTPHSAKTASTVDGIRRIAELGLGCMELEFVQGVRMGEAAARLVAQVAKEEGVRLTAHAPYFINFNAHEPEKIRASQERLLQTARIGAICGAESIAVHIAFYLGDPPERVYETVKKYLLEVIERLKRENNKIWIRPELMGKGTQFGTMDELLKLSTELERVAPVIDFAHWHARTGKFNSYPEFAAMLEQIKKQLGKDALNNMHIHFSGIAFSKKGETKHLDLRESDFQYKELLKALKDFKAKGFVICESPNLEEDAVLLQETYKRL